MVSVGLSILSWRGAESLKSSLGSYANANLFSLFDETQVFLPDPDDDVVRVCEEHPLNIRTMPQNLGIMENMRQAAKAISTDYVLMLENDCPLIESHEIAKERLETAIRILSNGDAMMARFRSLTSPGQAFTGLSKYQHLFDGSIQSKITRILRPSKVRRLAGYAVYDGGNSPERHPNLIQATQHDVFLIDAAAMPWTNQSILINRELFLNKIIPMAEGIKTNRGANKLPNLEIELNKSKAWRNSGWKIVCGPGLFTHERIGSRGYE